MRIYNLGHALLQHNIIFFFLSPLVKGINSFFTGGMVPTLSFPVFTASHVKYYALFVPSRIHGLKIMLCLCVIVLFCLFADIFFICA